MTCTRPHVIGNYSDAKGRPDKSSNRSFALAEPSRELRSLQERISRQANQSPLTPKMTNSRMIADAGAEPTRFIGRQAVTPRRPFPCSDRTNIGAGSSPACRIVRLNPSGVDVSALDPAALRSYRKGKYYHAVINAN